MNIYDIIFAKIIGWQSALLVSACWCNFVLISRSPDFQTIFSITSFIDEAESIST